MLGFYGNKHSGYVVNPMAPEHPLPIPTSLPYHLEVITCLFAEIHKGYICINFAAKINNTNFSTFIHCMWFCSHGNTLHPAPFDIYPMYYYCFMVHPPIHNPLPHFLNWKDNLTVKVFHPGSTIYQFSSDL